LVKQSIQKMSLLLQVLEKGLNKNNSDTQKKSKIENYIIANNNDCLKDMQNIAEKMGYKVTTIQIFGDIKEAVIKILENISENQKNMSYFWRGDNSKSSRKRNGGKKSRVGFKVIKKYTEIKKNGHCIYGYRWN